MATDKIDSKYLVERSSKADVFKYLDSDNLSRNYSNAIKRLSLWVDLQNSVLMNVEIKNILNFTPQDSYTKDSKKRKMDEIEFKKNNIYSIGNYLFQKKQYLHVFRTLHKSINQNNIGLCKNVLERLFPFNYLSEIKKQDVEIDPVVVLALIRQESAFNPQARSIAGARGLMQLMPLTARRISSNSNNKRLATPGENIRIGVQYLDQLVKKYNGSLIHAFAAYNAGETAVARWSKSILQHKDPLVMIESIPYKETRVYVKLLYRNMFFYNVVLKNNKNKFFNQRGLYENY